MGEIVYQLRWSLPLWAIGVLTNWLPVNRLSIRLRGWMMGPFVGKCGRNFQVGPQVQLLSPHGLTVGDNVYIATGCWLNCLAGITLEDEVMLGPYVVISTCQHRFKDGSARFGGSTTAPVVVGRGSWLGAHVAVKCGVRIGGGNLIGANSCVVRDTLERVVCGGVPARVIGENVDAPGVQFTRAEFISRDGAA